MSITLSPSKISLGILSKIQGSIPFVDDKENLIEDNPNLFWDDVNNRLGIGIASPTELVQLQKVGQDNYLKIDAGSIANNYSGIMLSEHNINFGWTIRQNSGSDRLFISIQDNALTFTDLVTYKRDGKIDAPKDHQIFTATINGSGTWQTVNYPIAFPAGATVGIIGTPQDDNGADYFIRVRNVGLSNFQFRPRNHTGTVHTGAGVVGFLAIRST